MPTPPSTAGAVGPPGSDLGREQDDLDATRRKRLGGVLDQDDPLGELTVRWTGGSIEEAAAQAELDRARDEEEEYGG